MQSISACQVLDKAASGIKSAFDEAERQLISAQDDVKKAKRDCKRKMELECDNCRDLKCKQAEEDCKDFLDDAGKWIENAGKTTRKLSLITRNLGRYHVLTGNL